jgi:predicted PurR-regulated permease PerM
MSPASSPRDASSDIRLALWVIAVVALLFLLQAAKTLFIPIVIAAVISYALAPVVTWLEEHRIPAIAGAGLVLFAILGAAASGAYAVRHDARMLVETVPEAMQRWRDHVMAQIGPATQAIERATEEPEPESAGDAGSGADTQTSGGETQLTGSLVQRLVRAMFGFVGHLVVVFFLVYFLLISGNHIRDRLVEISGPDPDRRRVTATIVNDINAQIQRYLLVLLVTGVIVGVATSLVLLSLGVQHAAIWGILAGIFNSIPYFGPVIVSGGLFVVGFAQDGGLAQALKMSGAAIVITSLEGWLLTPALMGKAERMSALAVFLGLLLWTWVWGPWGTVLAVPMLVVIKSVADHVERLRPLGRLMAP